jgi:hypothetical protein
MSLLRVDAAQCKKICQRGRIGLALKGLVGFEKKINGTTFHHHFYVNKPERFFGLQVRCRELDIFKILGIF